jgi:hypothetical protein
MPASKTLLQAIAVTTDLTGTQMSPAAAKVMAEDLARYPEEQVLGALVRCRRELKGRLTIADVLTRLDDGRPGAEEAWSSIPKDEAGSVVWTEEMREAYSVASPLIQAGDLVPARMAFLERYRAAVQRARDAHLGVEWSFSPGTDKSGRELALLDAAEKGRISVEAVQRMLPHHREDAGLTARLLAIGERSAGLKKIGDQLRLPEKAA